MSEFDYEIHDVIGIAKRRYDTSLHADIYIIGYVYDGKHYKIFNKTEIEAHFKPLGHVFGYKFRETLLNKVIRLHIDEDENKDELGKDRFRADYITTQPLVYGTTINNLDKFNPLYEAIKSHNTNEYYQNGNEIYYFNPSDSLRGIVKTWKINDDFFNRNNDIYKHDDIYIIGEHITDKTYYYSEAFDNDGIIKYVIEIIKKHDILPSKINTISDGLIKLFNIPIDILKNRLSVFRNLLDSSVLTHQNISDLASNPILAEVLQKSIKENEDEYIQTYEEHNRDVINIIEKTKEDKIKKNEIEYLRIEREHKNKVISIEKEIKIKETKLEQVTAQIRKKEKEVELLNERFVEIDKQRDRLVEDFSVIRDVLGSSNNIETKRALPVNIQRVECNGELIVEFDDFKTLLEQHLSSRDLSKDIALGIIRLFVAQNDDRKNSSVMMFPNVKLIKAFIDSIGQYNLLSLSIGAHWKSFDDLYFGGLREMIISANEYPNIIHILVLQNMNLSYIPSYMQPINDILNGICSTLPVDSNIFPANLWIFGTRTSLSDEAIPIPIEYISEYGCVENKNYHHDGDNEIITTDSYITMDFVNSQRAEERGCKSYHNPQSYLD